MARPWNLVEDAIKNALPGMANGTKDNIVVTAKQQLPNAGTGTYAVASSIADASAVVQSTGAYSATNNIHAEIAAIDGLPTTFWANPNNAVIASSAPPCKRCAAILSVYRKEFSWTVKAPSKEFHSTYAGGYDLPNSVLTRVIARLKTLDVLKTDEDTRFEQKIKSLISGWNG